MEQTTFFEHYRICVDESDAPVEVCRTGAAINYKAIDTRSHETVALQLIPLAALDPAKRAQFEERAHTAQKLDHINIAKVLEAGIDRDYFALVSEQLEGETADAWIVAHGPMLSDAVLRVGLQVVRAIGAAAFFGLTHRSIQPPNIMIVPGQSPDGGWPFVKLLNFGLAGVELHSERDPAREIAPSAAPEFASPEQRLNREIDFRSEIYSLGATMCFLLTGAAPLAISGMRARLRLGRLPEFRRAPRVMRHLLASMLRENPENRPQDPVALEADLRDRLKKVERYYAIRRKLGIPLAAVVPKKSEPPKTVFGQIWRGALAAAVLLMAATAAAAYFFPDYVPLLHRSEKIGVPVGVAETTSSSSPIPQPNSPPVANNSAAVQVTPNPSSTAQQPAMSQAEASAAASNDSSAQIASVAGPSAAAPPAEGPADESTEEKNPATADQSSSQSNQPATSSRRKTITPIARAKSTSREAQIAEARANEGRVLHRVAHGVWGRARLLGRTPDGRMILRLPSGRTVVVRPPRHRGDEDDAFLPRRRTFIDDGENVGPQPFYQPPYPSDD